MSDGWESAHTWMARHSKREDDEFSRHRYLVYLARMMEETASAEGDE